MNSKPVLRRAQARRDLEAATSYYQEEDGPSLADRFLDAVQEAFGRVGRHPRAGSRRYGLEAGISDLRSRPVSRFPYLIFYVETANAVEVVRVLHSHSDIPARLHEGDGRDWDVEETGSH